MRREIAVAQAEPVRPRTVGGQLLLDGERLTGPPPALLLADAAAERVHHCVEVGADMEAEQRDVIARVADDRNPGVRCGGPQAAQEPGTADAAREQRDPHDKRVCRISQPNCPPESRQRSVRIGAGVADGGLEAGTPGFREDFPVITGKEAGFITYPP